MFLEFGNSLGPHRFLKWNVIPVLCLAICTLHDHWYFINHNSVLWPSSDFPSKHAIGVRARSSMYWLNGNHCTCHVSLKLRWKAPNVTLTRHFLDTGNFRPSMTTRSNGAIIGFSKSWAYFLWSVYHKVGDDWNATSESYFRKPNRSNIGFTLTTILLCPNTCIRILPIFILDLC